MSEIVERVRQVIRDNPDRPNAAGLEVIDAKIAEERGVKWERLVKAARSIEPKEKKGA